MSESLSGGTCFDVLIVGAGMGGAQAAIALRRHGFIGSIGILGAEPDAPYDRPALSKGYLLGTDSEQKILTRPHDFWASQDITLIVNETVVFVDPEGHRAGTRSGHTFGYTHLIWSAGGLPRRLNLPGADSRSVHYVRSRSDVDALRRALGDARRVVIVGGGYIGLETAAAIRSRGVDVTVLETADRLLARVTGPQIAMFLAAAHRARGVDIRTSVTPERVVEHQGELTGVSLADGSTIPGDLVVVGIGIEPTVGPLADAGAACTNGVEVDQSCRTSLSDVFAIGDCALHRQPFASDQFVRLESVQNAHDQADIVARNIIGEQARYDSVPWFWSSQYDIRLQTAGIPRDYDSVEVIGDVQEQRFSVRYLRDGVMVAADCVNSPRDYMSARKLLATQR